MGKRSRKRTGGAAGPRSASHELQAPTTTYTHDEAGELELRGSLTAKARAEYAAAMGGGLEREDAWQRAAELLFERLAVSWTIAGVRTERQKELIGRYRIASAEERRFVRESLRAHVAENFPQVEAP